MKKISVVNLMFDCKVSSIIYICVTTEFTETQDGTTGTISHVPEYINSSQEYGQVRIKILFSIVQDCLETFLNYTSVSNIIKQCTRLHKTYRHTRLVNVVLTKKIIIFSLYLSTVNSGSSRNWKNRLKPSGYHRILTCQNEIY